MTEHTPGPWIAERIEEEQGKPEHWTITDALGEPVAAVYHGGLEWEEFDDNAHLIAAAPALLEALEGITRWKDELMRAGLIAGTDPCWKQARAALAQAKGRA